MILKGGKYMQIKKRKKQTFKKLLVFVISAILVTMVMGSVNAIDESKDDPSNVVLIGSNIDSKSIESEGDLTELKADEISAQKLKEADVIMAEYTSVVQSHHALDTLREQFSQNSKWSGDAFIMFSEQPILFESNINEEIDQSHLEGEKIRELKPEKIHYAITDSFEWITGRDVDRPVVAIGLLNGEEKRKNSRVLTYQYHGEIDEGSILEKTYTTFSKEFTRAENTLSYHNVNGFSFTGEEAFEIFESNRYWVRFDITAHVMNTDQATGHPDNHFTVVSDVDHRSEDFISEWYEIGWIFRKTKSFMYGPYDDGYYRDEEPSQYYEKSDSTASISLEAPVIGGPSYTYSWDITDVSVDPTSDEDMYNVDTNFDTGQLHPLIHENPAKLSHNQYESEEAATIETSESQIDLEVDHHLEMFRKWVPEGGIKETENFWINWDTNLDPDATYDAPEIDEGYVTGDGHEIVWNHNDAESGQLSDVPIENYEVYRNGNKIADVHPSEKDEYGDIYFECDNPEEGENEYTIRAENHYGLSPHSDPITIEWWEGEYELTISHSGPGNTDPSEGTHIYSAGEEVSLSAWADPNYEFDHWKLDGEVYSYNSHITVKMDEDKSFTAYFYPEGITRKDN